jgi:hypothetical protein
VRRLGSFLAGQLLDLGRPLVHVQGRNADQEDGRRLDRELHAKRHEEGVEEPAGPGRAVGLGHHPVHEPGGGARRREPGEMRHCRAELIELPPAVGARGQVGFERPTLGNREGVVQQR